MKNKIKIACFGEVLWDLFPGRDKKIGGAPFNVAYNLFKMGVEATIISAVGSDILGGEILAKIKEWDISDATIQVSEIYPTSTVTASFNEHKEAQYDIKTGVAWDYIETIPEDVLLVGIVEALVFGSLASRSLQSKSTLFSLLENSTYNVFDINLRKPHYDLKTIKELMHKSNLVKFNEAELFLLLDSLGKNYTSQENAISYLQETFGMREIIISQGSKGALYVKDSNFYQYPAFKINVQDTVGSGDAFLAGFLSKRFEKDCSVDHIMKQATALGAFITSKEGACPDYTMSDFNCFYKEILLQELGNTAQIIKV